MASKGYASVNQLAAYTGRTFTSQQQLLADIVIEAAENAIDAEIQHAWLETGPITEVIFNPQGPYITLSKAPIISVTSINMSAPACVDLALTADQSYFVQDLRDGRIWLPYSAYAYKLTVIYVPNADPVPAEVHMATLVAAAAGMTQAGALSDGVDPSLVQRYVVGGELEVEFRKSVAFGGAGGGLPQQAINYLDAWRRGYVVV